MRQRTIGAVAALAVLMGCSSTTNVYQVAGDAGASSASGGVQGGGAVDGGAPGPDPGRGRKCFASRDGTFCGCSTDPTYVGSGHLGPNGETIEDDRAVAACEPGTSVAISGGPAEPDPFCCGEVKNGFEKCSCGLLACVTSDGTCSCGRTYVVRDGDRPFTDSCPLKTSEQHCCNDRSKPSCRCSASECVPELETEVAECLVGSMNRTCATKDDGHPVPTSTCLFPSEMH
jgi:hypothetical protein